MPKSVSSNSSCSNDMWAKCFLYTKKKKFLYGFVFLSVFFFLYIYCKFKAWFLLLIVLTGETLRRSLLILRSTTFTCCLLLSVTKTPRGPIEEKQKNKNKSASLLCIRSESLRIDAQATPAVRFFYKFQLASMSRSHLSSVSSFKKKEKRFSQHFLH